MKPGEDRQLPGTKPARRAGAVVTARQGRHAFQVPAARPASGLWLPSSAGWPSYRLVPQGQREAARLGQGHYFSTRARPIDARTLAPPEA
jgi:hypothetical protein